MNSNHDVEFDAMDRWLQTQRCEPPPAELRDRCLATVSVLEDNRPAQTSRLRRLWARPTVRISAAAAVLAAVWVGWSLIPGTPSLFAQAIKEMEQAPAVHIVTKISETRDPDKRVVSEVWRLRDAGISQRIKVNDEVTWQIIDDRKDRIVWSPSRKELTKSPSMLKVYGSRDEWWMGLLQLDQIQDRHEQWAKSSDKPAKVEDLTQDGRRIRRTTIGPDAQVFNAMTSSLMLDVDQATGRPVRFVITFKHPTYTRTDDYRIEYPAPETVDRSLFVLKLPDDVKETRPGDEPVKPRSDEFAVIESQLKQIGLAMHNYLDDRAPDDRLSKEWVRDLLPYLGDSRVTYLVDDDKSEDRSKPDYTSFRFFHGGEKLSALKNLRETVIVEYRHSSGAVIKLYADGRTDVADK